MNGELAEPNEFRYIVSIGDRGKYPHGVGSIIDKRWILTARHIVLKTFKDKRASSFNFSWVRDVIIRPKYSNNLNESYEHPGYEPKKMFCYPPSDDVQKYLTDSDIALIKLDCPLPLKKRPFNFAKIKMIPNELNFDNGYNITVAGWGRTDPDVARTNFRLRKAIMQSSSYPSGPGGRYRAIQQIHVDGFERSFCNGDSGGPGVMIDVQSGKEVLAGIISWGLSPLCR